MILIDNVLCKYGKGGYSKMRKVNVYTVTKFTKVDPTLYIEGSLFIEQGTDKVAVMANGKLKQINGTVPSLNGYVKKTEVEAMIAEAIEGMSPVE